MAIGYVEALSGASGDMWLGALVGAGASVEIIQDAVDTLGSGDVRLTFARVIRAGTQATMVRVHAPEQTPPVRTWSQIRSIIDYLALDDEVREMACEVFHRIASARAAASGERLENVRFHEVGTLDALADVIGASAALHSLGLDRLDCGPVVIGPADDRGRRGRPDPIVARMLAGFTLVPATHSHDLVTVTGAALLAALCRPVESRPPMTVEREGAGAGARDLAGAPNVLRLSIGVAQRSDLAATTLPRG